MNAYEAAILGRLSVLWQRRAVDRRVYGAAWPQARWDRHMELRALIAVARTGRRLAREAVERADPVTASKSYHDWQAAGPVTEADLFAGYGIDNIEGDPAFNGAFR